MTERRTRSGVVIVPQQDRCGPPRYGGRLAHEHDQNDSINARLDWVDKFNSIQKSREDAAVNKANSKMQETKGKAGQSAIFWICVILVLAPIITSIEKAIITKIFGIGF